ncbi:zona pellucida sperm-binding protein 4-like [Lampris incognitus]|uniref:zona pellucida sperm-binding protein 4-like n=1 Tax=Lampris incognitus TaxID=2546036 RepID=UPI0024B4DAE2|nr:zona pellucida sperm-binding protein 4-like [Lampris incognitus]
MAKYRSATCYVALTVLGCMLPQNPTKPQNPTYPKQPQVPKNPKHQSEPPQEPEKPLQLENAQVNDFQQQVNKGYPAQVPKQPPSALPLLCEVPQRQRVRCGEPDIPLTGCEMLGCCFEGNMCFYGKAVTVQCTKDAQFIVVVARDATLPNIDLESLSLLRQGQGCTHVDYNSGFVIYQFPVTACGSLVMEEPGVIIYENMITSTYEVEVGPHGAITRDSSFQLLFRCRYGSISSSLIVVEVEPILDPPLPAFGVGPVRVELRLASGQCTTKGCYEEDVAYTSYYTEADFPVSKVLRESVYVEVRLLEKTDPNLVLTLGHCWTTSTLNPHSLPQWDILTDGCPYDNDRYLSALVPVSPDVLYPTHYRRFLFQMFTFVDPQSMTALHEKVYVHCSVAVCTPAQGYSCEPSCHRKRKFKRDLSAIAAHKTEPKVVVSAVGPVLLSSPEE